MALALVIDDEPAMRRIVRLILEEGGHTVLEAKNGRDGFRVFSENMPSIAIVDLFMPEQDGIQTVREMRKLCPDVKIIAISGGGAYGLDLLDGLEELGANSTLAKPFRKDDLLRAVEQALAHDAPGRL